MLHRLEQWNKLLSEGAGNYYASVSPQEQQYFRTWVQGLLQERAVIVDFDKATGEHRRMECTLNESLGAKYTKKNATEKTRKSNPNVCVVWDTCQGAWRSFRWDRVKRIQFNIG